MPPVPARSRRGAGIDDILQAERLLDERDVDPSMRLWAMIETPIGLLNVRDIAGLATERRSRRLAGLVLGTNDIAKDTGVQPGPDRAPLVPWLLQAVLVARACGLFVLDGVFNAFADVEGFERECAQGRQFGFDGKTLIHPSQIACANRTFAPAPREVEEARAIIDAFALPENHDKGAINLNGRMVERLHAESTAQLWQWTHASAAAAPESAGTPAPSDSTVADADTIIMVFRCLRHHPHTLPRAPCPRRHRPW
jgi:citrate lyase subunit beta/citryl-CoA lyase